MHKAGKHTQLCSPEMCITCCIMSYPYFCELLSVHFWHILNFKRDWISLSTYAISLVILLVDRVLYFSPAFIRLSCIFFGALSLAHGWGFQALFLGVSHRCVTPVIISPKYKTPCPTRQTRIILNGRRFFLLPHTVRRPRERTQKAGCL